jgi:uncharacterized tellurite resistance protein B-like protein
VAFYYSPFLFAIFRNIARMVIHKTFADFVLFLYVHMAYADGEYHPKEHEVIIGKVPKLFPSETNPASLVVQAEEQYRGTDKSKVGLIIRESFRHFSSVKFSQKYKIYTDMYDIIHADGKVDESETMALNELKDIIEMGASVRG